MNQLRKKQVTTDGMQKDKHPNSNKIIQIQIPQCEQIAFKLYSTQLAENTADNQLRQNSNFFCVTAFFLPLMYTQIITQ